MARRKRPKLEPVPDPEPLEVDEDGLDDEQRGVVERIRRHERELAAWRAQLAGGPVVTALDDRELRYLVEQKRRHVTVLRRQLDGAA